MWCVRCYRRTRFWPYRWRACEGSGAVAWWGSGKCHSSLGAGAWSPRRDGDSPGLTHRYTSGPALSLSAVRRWVLTQFVNNTPYFNICLSVHSLVLMRNWLETPGWSTSWIAAANRAARISRSVKTAWKGDRKRKELNELQTNHQVPLFQEDRELCLIRFTFTFNFDSVSEMSFG